MITLFLILAVLHISVSNAELLDFYQDEYYIALDRAECTWYNRTTFKYFKVEFVPFNRTQRVLNGSFELIDVAYPDIRMDIQVYKFMSNEYRFFPITVSIDACHEYSRNTFRTKDIFSKASNIDPCHLKTGYHYVVYNALPDYSTFPPHLPSGMYKLVCKFRRNTETYTKLEFYGTIKERIEKFFKRN